MKMWSFASTEDFSGIYGAGGEPLERRIVRWGELTGAVTYPPMAIVELYVSARIYKAFRPDYPDSPWLTVLVKMPGLLAEMLMAAVLLTAGRKMLGDRAATWSAVAFWMNPGIWFAGPGLGYFDAQAAVLMVIAFICVYRDRPLAVGALSAVAALTKPQAVFFLPVLAVLLLRGQDRLRWTALVRATAGGVAATFAIMLPFILRGSVPNVLQAMSRLFQHDMLSANAANLGWIGTWFFRVIPGIPDLGWHKALTMVIRILSIRRLMEIGYPNFRTVGTVLTSASLVWAMWRTWRGVSTPVAAALAAWCIYAYMMLGAQVHENHFYMTMPMLALAAGPLAEVRWAYWWSSLIFVANLYVFEGLGAGHPSLFDRRWTFIDVTVLLAAANFVVFVLFTRQLVRLTRAGGGLPRGA